MQTLIYSYIIYQREYVISTYNVGCNNKLVFHFNLVICGSSCLKIKNFVNLIENLIVISRITKKEKKLDFWNEIIKSYWTRNPNGLRA